MAQQDEGTSRYADLSNASDFEAYVQSYRRDIGVLDAELHQLDRLIEAEKQRVRETKALLDRCYVGRNRMLALRTAMLNFVIELEQRNDTALPSDF